MRTFNQEPSEVRAEAKAFEKLMPGWKAEHSSRNCHFFSLSNEKGQTLGVSLNDAPKSYRISFSWPEDKQHNSYTIEGEDNSISCSFQKGPEWAVHNIERRLLPVLDRCWNQAVKRRDAAEAAIEAKRQVEERLGKKLGSKRQPWENALYGKGHIYKVWVEYAGKTARIELYSMPVELVEKIIDLIQKNDPESA